MSWLEEKYIGLVSVRLERFKRRGNVYNFRCPLCGDSQKDKTKSRGYLYQKKDSYVFHCHNCNATQRFQTFLKHIDASLADEYSKEVFMDNKGFNQKPLTPQKSIEVVSRPKFLTKGPLKSIKRVSQLPPSHPAKMYVDKRKIPTNYHYKLFYAPKFMTWVNTIIPNKFSEQALLHDEPRLVIPFLDRDGNVYGFQGRSFRKDGVRYITIMIDTEKPKIFGLDAVDFNKKIYIFEGPIDSMFVPNSLAMAGADMIHAQSLLKLNPAKCVVVMDNEPRNEQITKRIGSFIDMGFNVCIWPQHVLQKDVNDMVLAGLRPADLKLIIDQSTYSGLGAKMALTGWKRC